MRRSRPRSRCAPAALLALLLAAAGPLAAAATEGTLSVPIPVGEVRVEHTERGPEVSVEGYGMLPVPGGPRLPARIFALAVPPGAEVLEVIGQTGPGIELPGTYDLPPVPRPRVIGVEDPQVEAARQAEWEATRAAVYSADAAYPAQVVEFVQRAGYREYDLVDVRVAPLSYRPQSGTLTYYPQITVQVRYRLPAGWSAVPVAGTSRTAAVARGLILNLAAAEAWYPAAPRAERGLHDYVVITTMPLTVPIAPLVQWETAKGRNVRVVTLDYVTTNYTGYDLAERIRNFLRDCYPAGAWGIEDVLIVGDYATVPMRRTQQDLGYGKPETDFYYAELSLPDSQSWDADGDRRWGEDTDPIDFYAEVNVGRIPWSDAATVQHICEKSVAYEQNGDPAFKKNILLLGAFFWNNDPNPRTDNAVLMEAKLGRPWMADWTATRMYEQNSTCWSTYPCDYPLLHSNVLAAWSAGPFAFVNWAGHGSPTSAHIYGLGAPAFISSSDCNSLNDACPAIVFADACSNSDTDTLNIGQAMLKRGAVGFVGATKVALGCPGWAGPGDGSSQSLDYYFTGYVTSGEYTQGAALQRALRDMYTYGLWSYLRYETFEWGALWGNPDLGLGGPPLVSISLPEGAPQHVAPGVATTVPVRVRAGADTYVEGSATLHYRYDGGEYQAVPLVSLGGEQFEATLPPARCTHTPEFYFSAAGVAAGVVTYPTGAPASTLSAAVGVPVTVVDDDFETDGGWTAASLGASSGLWQRGVPVNDPNWAYDPESDSDGSGQCWLTQNALGNTDVDNGAVQLTSPAYDLSGGAVTIAYDYFLRLTETGGGVDRLLVELDGNGGAGPWVEIARHTTDGGLSWRHHVIDAAALAAAGANLTPATRLRFTANDADPQSIVEAGLDALLITALVCEDALPGDTDCDGAVTFSDIDPFVLALSGQAAYEAAYPDCDWLSADCNGDGLVSFADIDAFVVLLAGRG